jgi:CysZ protein
MRRALADLGDRQFRRVLFKALALTLLLLAGLGYGLFTLAGLGLPYLPDWLRMPAEVVAGLGTVALGLFLFIPVAALFAGLFLDAIVDAVLARDYPGDPKPREVSLFTALASGLVFMLAVIAVNLLALPLYLVPGANLLVFFAVNGYLIGREYFELVALRHVSAREARQLRRRHRLRVLAAGVVIALALSVPIANLFAPLFGAAFMVHVFKGLPTHAAA